MPPAPDERSELKDELTALRTRLGDADFEAALADGRRLTLDEATRPALPAGAD